MNVVVADGEPDTEPELVEEPGGACPGLEGNPSSSADSSSSEAEPHESCQEAPPMKVRKCAQAQLVLKNVRVSRLGF